MKKILTWIDNARAIALPQSVLPALAAYALAARQSTFNWWLGLLGILGVMLAHLGMNLADDYGDAEKNVSKIRESMPEEGYILRMPKSPYLENGTSMKQLACAVCVFLGLACLCGLPIILMRNWVPVAIIVAIAAFLGITYSCRPFRLSYHGLGEFVIGIMFGPLNMAGIYYSACGVFTNELMWASLAIGLLVINIVYTHSVLDVDGDQHIGKLTLARAMKSKEGEMFWMYFCNILPFMIIAGGVISGIFHPAYLATLLVFPMAVFHLGSVYKFVYDIPYDTAHPAKWLGNMGPWEEIVKHNLDWYMFRWLVARNIVTNFCLVYTIVTLILVFTVK